METELSLPTHSLVDFVKELLSSPETMALLVKHGLLKTAVTDKVSVAEILAVLQAICAGAAVVCPIIEGM